MRSFDLLGGACWLVGCAGLMLAGCDSNSKCPPASEEASGCDVRSQVAGSSGSGSDDGSVSGSGGSGGSGSGSSGGATACQAKPDTTPSLPTPASLDANWVARAAAVIGSCMPDDGVDRNAAHLWQAHFSAPRIYFRLGEQLDCFANANCGCAAVEHCMGWVYSEAPANCSATCTGDVFTGCGDGVQVSVDCSRFGLGCNTNASCVAEPPVACDNADAPTCTAQGEVQACNDELLRKTPCASLGFSCVEGKCVGKGAACNDDSVDYEGEAITPVGTGCVGDTLSACLGGHATTLDCAAQGAGFSCQSLNGAFFCGLAAECEPAGHYSHSPTAASCDGSVLSFCNAGRLEHLDCKSLGFTGCDLDGEDHYGCVPGNAFVGGD